MIIGKSPEVRKLETLVNHVAVTDLPVLIIGEPGTYKEWSARLIHEKSTREGKPFVKVNCNNVTKDGLFGSQTKDSVVDKRVFGKFEVANNGTLFFDRIADLDPDLQGLLLRVTEDKEILSLGGEDVIIDVRIVASSNQDLERAALESKFRKDLYYRLSAIKIHLPPLRERKEDIPDLIFFFLNKYSNQFDNSRIDNSRINLTTRDLDILTEYNWPGNIRELDHFVKSLVVLGDIRTCIERISRLASLNNPHSRWSLLQSEKDGARVEPLNLNKINVRN